MPEQLHERDGTILAHREWAALPPELFVYAGALTRGGRRVLAEGLEVRPKERTTSTLR
nr:hypothetical protein [Pseudomonas aeruginosa]